MKKIRKYGSCTEKIKFILRYTNVGLTRQRLQTVLNMLTEVQEKNTVRKETTSIIYEQIENIKKR